MDYHNKIQKNKWRQIPQKGNQLDELQLVIYKPPHYRARNMWSYYESFLQISKIRSAQFHWQLSTRWKNVWALHS